MTQWPYISEQYGMANMMLHCFTKTWIKDASRESFLPWNQITFTTCPSPAPAFGRLRSRSSLDPKLYRMSPDNSTQPGLDNKWIVGIWMIFLGTQDQKICSGDTIIFEKTPPATFLLGLNQLQWPTYTQIWCNFLGSLHLQLRSQRLFFFAFLTHARGHRCLVAFSRLQGRISQSWRFKHMTS